MDDPIKPCPFCGDEHVHVDEIDEVFRAVECACGARGPVRGTEEDDEEFGTDYAAAARRDAIACWNDAPRVERAGKIVTWTGPRTHDAEGLPYPGTLPACPRCGTGGKWWCGALSRCSHCRATRDTVKKILRIQARAHADAESEADRG